MKIDKMTILYDSSEKMTKPNQKIVWTTPTLSMTRKNLGQTYQTS